VVPAGFCGVVVCEKPYTETTNIKRISVANLQTFFMGISLIDL
jgi:hypothetical protein